MQAVAGRADAAGAAGADGAGTRGQDSGGYLRTTVGAWEVWLELGNSYGNSELM